MYLVDLVKRCSEESSVCNGKRNNLRVIIEEAQNQVLGLFVAELIKSLRTVEQTGISYETVEKH